LREAAIVYDLSAGRQRCGVGQFLAKLPRVLIMKHRLLVNDEGSSILQNETRPKEPSHHHRHAGAHRSCYAITCILALTNVRSSNFTRESGKTVGVRWWSICFHSTERSLFIRKICPLEVCQREIVLFNRGSTMLLN